jgi:hypothetical protein
VKPMTEPAAEAAIRVACRELHLPTIAAEATRIADDAARERLTIAGSWPRCWPPRSMSVPTAAAPAGGTRPGSPA